MFVRVAQPLKQYKGVSVCRAQRGRPVSLKRLKTLDEQSSSLWKLVYVASSIPLELRFIRVDRKRDS